MESLDSVSLLSSSLVLLDQEKGEKSKFCSQCVRHLLMLHSRTCMVQRKILRTLKISSPSLISTSHLPCFSNDHHTYLLIYSNYLIQPHIHSLWGFGVLG